MHHTRETGPFFSRADQFSFSFRLLFNIYILCILLGMSADIVKDLPSEAACDDYALTVISSAGAKNQFQIIGEGGHLLDFGCIIVKWSENPKPHCTFALYFFDDDTEIELRFKGVKSLIFYINQQNPRWYWPFGIPEWLVYELSDDETQSAMRELSYMYEHYEQKCVAGARRCLQHHASMKDIYSRLTV
jgi:hypothetical protein